MVGQLHQCVADHRVVSETLGAGEHPLVHRFLQRPHLRGQLLAEPLRIVDQIAGVDVEEAGQRRTGGIGQVRPPSALDLGEVGLAQLHPMLALDGVDHGLLGQLPVEPPKGSLDRA